MKKGGENEPFVCLFADSVVCIGGLGLLLTKKNMLEHNTSFIPNQVISNVFL